ncbi:predicted protein [Nematostella vectensis]|uniref:Major facilitator superfamily (MFS) profile domain-containing protein n=2 Tax=Nematostella vectensis TaxID=45351 RepID=A7S0E6_NEMVE|nr:predicted protein [Nematostella vectensis]|eukprot:XP_001634924.1 predicted protein [Nematostella vectensis]
MVLATFIAALGPLSFGFCLGYSSSALEDLIAESKESVKLTVSQGSWFSSLVTLGAILGAPLGGWTLEYFGRKGTIMACAVPFEVGWMLIAYANSHYMLYIGRFITGLAVGMVSLTVPVYIAEISSPSLRGMLGSVNQLAVTMGLLLAYSMGVVLKWRWLACSGAIFPALLVVLMFFVPETPRWSLSHKRRRDALDAMMWFRGPEADVEEECYRIEATMDNTQSMSCAEFCRPAIMKPLFISIALMFFQQFCGINAILFNSASIFHQAGFQDSKAVSVIIGAVQFVGTGIACLVVDKAGRKLLLWTTALGMTVSLIALGFYFELYIPTTQEQPTPTPALLESIHHSIPAGKISWLAITSIVVFNLVFALAWGPVPWLVMSEIFPLQARGIASSISTLCNWSLAFAVTKTFVNIEDAITIQGTYWFYGGLSFLGFLFVLMFVPETKGKTLEQIERLFDGTLVTPREEIQSS